MDGYFRWPCNAGWRPPAARTIGCWTAAAVQQWTWAVALAVWLPGWPSEACRRWAWTARPQRCGIVMLVARGCCTATSSPRCPGRESGTTCCWPTATSASGGDPVRLLHRCTSLLRPSGTILIEVGRPGAGLWQGTARLEVAGIAAGPWFPWAVAGLQAFAVLAAHIELRVAHRHYGCRCFIELRLPSRRGMSADGKPQLVPNGVRGK